MLFKRKRRLTVTFVYHKNGAIQPLVKIDGELPVDKLLTVLKRTQQELEARLIRAGQLKGLDYRKPATRAFIAKTKVKDLH